MSRRRRVQAKSQRVLVEGSDKGRSWQVRVSPSLPYKGAKGQFKAIGKLVNPDGSEQMLSCRTSRANRAIKARRADQKFVAL